MPHWCDGNLEEQRNCREILLRYVTSDEIFVVATVNEIWKIFLLRVALTLY